MMTRILRGRTDQGGLLAGLDALLAVAAFVLAYVVRYELQIIRPVNEFSRSPFPPYIPYLIVFVVWLHLMYRGSGMYRTARWRPLAEELYSVLNGVANATLVVMALSFIFQPLVFSRLMLIYVAVIAIILLGGVRVAQRIIQARLRAEGVGVQRALVVGGGEVGSRVLRTLLARKELGYLPVAIMDETAADTNTDLGRVKVLNDFDQLPAALRDLQIEVVIITLSWTHHDRIVQLIRVIREHGIEVSVVPDAFQLNLRQVQIENLDGIPLLRVNGYVPLGGSNRLLKRALDVTLTLLTAPLWLPILGAVALAIRLEGEGSIFYTADRIGENGRRFRMIKFRSMIPGADRLRNELIDTHELDPRLPKIKDDPRVTKVGRFIRRTSLDELPNLFNVLTGHMSLVGPRPPTPDEVSLYSAWHLQRLQTKPGMTGLWQISGRSEVPFDEMCLLDIYYIENWSLALDAQILMMTIPRVLLRQGAY